MRAGLVHEVVNWDVNAPVTRCGIFVALLADEDRCIPGGKHPLVYGGGRDACRDCYRVEVPR